MMYVQETEDLTLDEVLSEAGMFPDDKGNDFLLHPEVDVDTPTHKKTPLWRQKSDSKGPEIARCCMDCRHRTPHCKMRGRDPIRAQEFSILEDMGRGSDCRHRSAATGLGSELRTLLHIRIRL